MRGQATIIVSVILAGFWGATAPANLKVTVGSKTFTESYILSELAAQVFESAGAQVTRKFGLGGTGVLFQALSTGDIDVYPEYTGTISEAILKRPQVRDLDEIRKALGPLHLVVSDPLGFNNAYAIAVRETFAKKNGLVRISDLQGVPTARAGFSHEFMKRADGLLALEKKYNFHIKNVNSMEHSLAYKALADDDVDMIDVYSTDAKLAKLGLITLEDDRHFFPAYYAVFLAREQFANKNPDLWKSLTDLGGRIGDTQMILMNGKAEFEGRRFSEIASEFVNTRTNDVKPRSELLERTKQHLGLVGFSLLASVMVGIPLGVAAAKRRMLRQIILVISSVVQTIPSLALLCFLIPLFGIGTKPALVALFLYGLLPIVVGTYTGITTLDPKLIESAKALGLSPFQRFKWVELPLASPQILAGVKTSAIIGIGTATLAALIGAGGYGAPIVTGLALNSPSMMLEGAIPAALLALLVHLIFEGARYVIPKGIR